MNSDHTFNKDHFFKKKKTKIGEEQKKERREGRGRDARREN